MHKVVSSQVIGSNGAGHGALAGVLAAGGVDVLICGGIGGGAINALAQTGIDIYPGAAGDCDDIVNAFLAGEVAQTGAPRVAAAVTATSTATAMRAAAATAMNMARAITAATSKREVNHCWIYLIYIALCLQLCR